MTILKIYAISVAVLDVQIWSVVFPVTSFIEETLFLWRRCTLYDIWLFTADRFGYNLNDSEHCVFIFRIDPVEFSNFCTLHSCATEPPWLFQCPFQKWWKWIRDPLNITDTIIWPLLARHNHDDRNTDQFKSCGSYARTEQYKQSEGVSSGGSYHKIKVVSSQFLNF